MGEAENSHLQILKRAAAPGRMLVIGGSDRFVALARAEAMRVADPITLPDFMAAGRDLGIFETVFCLADLAEVPEAHREAAVRALAAATHRTLLVAATITGGPTSRAVGSSADWEGRFLAQYLKRHPVCWMPQASPSRDGAPHILSFETLSPEVKERYPLERLQKARSLHMDMLREPGPRANAHLRRYQLASGFVAPGDVVLDAASGLGYGCSQIRRTTLAGDVIGIDESEYAIDYARRAYSSPKVAADFVRGVLPDILDEFEPASVDVVISFETLEHVDDPSGLIAAFRRILRPAGRLIVSVPNDWADETGTDPNPHHKHVYDWAKLAAQLSSGFYLGSRYGQIGSRLMQDRKWVPANPSLTQLPLDASRSIEAEWWIAVAHREPHDRNLPPYRDHLVASGHAHSFAAANRAAGFENPWLVPAISMRKTRPRDPSALLDLIQAARKTAGPRSADLAAALCADGYSSIERGACDGPGASLVVQIDEWLKEAGEDPPSIRWTVSLLFLKAQILERLGRADDALVAFLACFKTDFLKFDPVSATKIAAAGNRAAAHLIASGDADAAARTWRGVVDLALRALSESTSHAAGSGMPKPPYLFGELAQIASEAARANTYLSYVRDIDDYSKVSAVLAARAAGPIGRNRK